MRKFLIAARPQLVKTTCYLVAAVALTSCVSSQDTVTGPSGTAIHQAKCSGSPNACFKKASATCKGPYQVVDSHSNAGGIAADILPGPVTWYSMSYQCGQSDGRMPSFPFRGQQYVPPVVVQQTTPRTTTCNRIGNSVTCNSY